MSASGPVFRLSGSFSFFIFSMLILSIPNGLKAQEATLHGTVTDPSGAVIPGVSVTATNPNTGVTYRTLTNESGRYLIPALEPTTYTVSFEASGFRRVEQSGVLLEVDQRARLDMEMTIGELVEVVSVTADTSTVDTYGATFRDVVDSRRVEELPLNGRETLQLQALLPGAIQVQAGQAASFIAQNTDLSFAVNGARPNASAYTLDGGLNMDMYNNLATAFPNPDAIQEFSILENNYAADKGRNAGAVINMITKSGTNSFHGALWEFFRNDELNTKNFFSVDVPPLRKNQFGGSVGGPIIKDKAFFFGSWQSTRERTGRTSSDQILPTALERQGDFSQSDLPLGSVADPETVTSDNPQGTPFPNNVVPASRLDPVALNFAEAFFPLPNLPGNRFTQNVSVPEDEDQLTLRGDWVISRDNTLTFRWFFSDFRSTRNEALKDFNAGFNWKTNNFTLKDSHIVSPTIVNNVNFTFNRIKFIRGPLPTGPGQPKDWVDLGCASCFRLAPPDQVATDWAVSIANGFGVRVSTNFQSFMQTWQLADTLSVRKGNHQMSLGGEWSKARRVGREFFQESGSFAFDGLRTGSGFGFADFFTGVPRSIFQFSPLRSNPDRTNPFAFFQDDWQVHRQLTLNIGFRWAPFFPVAEKRDELQAFRPGSQSTLYPTAPPGLLFAGDLNGGIPRGIVDKDFDKFEPRFGFAFDPFGDGKTSIRGGYGIFYDTLRLVGINTTSINQPFTFGRTFFDPPSLSDPYGSGEFAEFKELLQSFTAPPQTQEGRNQQQFFLPVRANSIDSSFTSGYMQQWNFNIQRQMFQDIVLTVGYVGSKGTKFFVGQEINPAIFIPGQSTPGNIDSRRIHQGFQTIQNTQPTINSTYHSLQIKANKRFANGWTLLSSYTFSKSIDTTSNDGNSGTGSGARNPFDQAADKGLSDFDVESRFVGSFLWELPFFRRTSSGSKRLWLGGWQINGIFTLQTGTPFSVFAGQPRSLAGGTGDFVDLRPEFPEVETFNDRSNESKVERFFPTEAFALPALGEFGNVGRNFLRGPGIFNVDFAVFKNFAFKETQSVQFRWEVFNALNRTNFNNPNADFSSAAFGQLTSSRESRVIQFALKYRF